MELQFLTRRLVAAAALLLLAAPLAACSDDDNGEDEESSPATTAETTEEAEPESEAAQLGTELCEAFGAVEEPGGVDAVLGMLSDDVVFSDVVLGADLTGKEQVRAYLTSDAFEGIDSSECGAMVHRGSWGAGAYTLSDSETGAGGSGIAAVHVTDGLVDRQIVHYTQFEADAPPPPEDTVTEGVGFDYCHAWDDGADTEEVLSYMTDDATFVALEPLTGLEAIGAFVESFDFDQNDCATEGIKNGDWGALTNGFTNTTTSAGIEGVNVVRFEGDKVAAHYVYVDPVA
jgi:ketosteroid isomerase-like protein